MDKNIQNIITTVVKYKIITTFFIFLLACCLVFFFRLDVPSIRMWDESRQAVNALEMSLNGNWFVTYYDGKPDMWNTKPPILIWCIVLSMKLFGYNEFALRLPSAVCAMSTAIIVFWFCKNYFNDLKIGLSSGLVLITSNGYIGEHVARTADFDAMLVLWITIYSLSFFTYLHSKASKNYYLFITTAALVLAALTKSVAGILALPGIFIYTAYKRKLGKLLSLPHVYFSVIIFSVLVLGFYFSRDYYNPGYLKAVMANEITGRYSTVFENHEEPASFYLTQLKFKFVPWFYLIFASFIVIQNSSKIRIKNFGVFVLFYLSCYLLIVSFAKTKLPWYDAPVYPMASIVVGIGISEIFNSLIHYNQINEPLKRQLLASLMITGIFILPYFDTVYNKVYKQHGIIYDWSKTSNPQLMYGEYLKTIADIQPQITNFSVANNEYNAHLIFYTKVANLGSYSIKIKSSKEMFNKNEVVVTCDSEVKEELDQHYDLNSLHTSTPCYTFVVESGKTKKGSVVNVAPLSD